MKIGLVAPFEGQYRDIGYDAIYAARLAVREINAAGGVAGWRLELVAYDDRADPDMAATAARNIAVDPDVIAVIGHYRQESTAAATAIYHKAGVPLLVIGSWLDTSSTSEWHLMPPPEAFAFAMVDISRTSDPNTVAVWGDGPLSTAVNAAIAASGYQRISTSSVKDTPELLPELPPEVPAAIFSMLPSVEAATRLSSWRAAGWQGALIGDFNVAATSFARIAGAASEGTVAVTPYPFPEDVPGITAWMAAYRAVGPHVPEPGLYALPTYEAVYILAEAIMASVTGDGPPSRVGVSAAMPNVRRSGYLSDLQWDDAGYLQSTSVYVYRWERTQWHLVEQTKIDD